MANRSRRVGAQVALVPLSQVVKDLNHSSGIAELRQLASHFTKAIIFEAVRRAQLGFNKPQDTPDSFDALARLVNGFVAICVFFRLVV